jgi:hypothetical protein
MEDIVNQDPKQQEWSSKIAQWRQSGKSAKAWCQENKVIYTTFLGWRDRLRRTSSSHSHRTNPSSLQFIELKEKPTTSSGVSIECAGALIHLSAEFNSSTLKKCLEALRGGAC